MPPREQWPALIQAELARLPIVTMVTHAEAGGSVKELSASGTLSEHKYVVCRIARELRRAAAGEGTFRWDELKQRVAELRRLSELPVLK